MSRENTDLSMVPYRATIARAMLDVLPKEGDTRPSPAEFRPLQAVPAEDSSCKVPVLPLNNGDDVLCAELLRAIQTAGSLPPHPQTIHVTVFAEWDSLYGRALAETFAALAARGLSTPLEDPAFYPALLEALEKGLLVHHPPVGAPTAGTKIQVTVIPYLRGLDGASSLYRTNYGQTSEIRASKNQQDQNSESHPATLVEAAEGTTQFDYIRRLTSDSFTHNVPFWPQADRPDAVVIFGTDIYDKLVLLEFLRQQLRNCLYLTTDLDALYWHPHYLRFTRDLIVASAFPLRMSAGLCGSRQGSNTICAPVEFRDSYQSAAYLVVTRCLQQSGGPLSEVPFDFTPDSFLYRIGNTKPLPVLANSLNIQPGAAPPKSATEAFVGGIETGIGGLLEPIGEGISPFWPFVLQITVIALGLYSLFYDVPRRMQLCREASDELWNSALALVPKSLRSVVDDLRTGRIRSRWQKLPLRRQPWQPPPLKPIQRAPFSSEQSIKVRTLTICKHYAPLLDSATTKVEVAEIALCLLSDLFSLRSVTAVPQFGKQPLKCHGERKPAFAIEVQPFAEYLQRDLTSPQQRSEDAQSEEKSLLRRWVLKSLRFVDRRLPHSGFVVVGLVSVLMLIAICLQPVPFLVGPTTLSYGWRVALWLVSVGALLVTFFLFHRTCFEHWSINCRS